MSEDESAWCCGGRLKCKVSIRKNLQKKDTRIEKSVGGVSRGSYTSGVLLLGGV